MSRWFCPEAASCPEPRKRCKEEAGVFQQGPAEHFGWEVHHLVGLSWIWHSWLYPWQGSRLQWMFNSTTVSSSSLLILISINSTIQRVLFDPVITLYLFFICLQGPCTSFLWPPEYVTGWKVHSSTIILDVRTDFQQIRVLGLWERPKPRGWGRSTGFQSDSVSCSESTSGFRR